MDIRAQGRNALLNVPRAALAALTFAAMAPARAEPPPDALMKKLEALAGPSATDCGVAAAVAERAAPIACARAASAAQAPYRIAVRMQGDDAFVWQGAVRGADGKQWMVFYDADPSAGAGVNPTLSLLACRDIVFADKGDEVLECTPVTGIR